MDPNDPKQRQVSQNFALKAYERMKGHRAYALDADSKNKLAILATALIQKRNAAGRADGDGTPSAQQEMTELLTKLGDAGLNLFQRRASTPRPLPKLWLDPVSGQPLGPPKDLKERSLLEQTDPVLLAHFDSMANSPYARVLKLRQEEAQRKIIDAIPYSPDTHNPTVNPFLGTDMTAQGQFEKNVNPETLAFYKYEAQPVRLDLFGKDKNMTTLVRLKKDPDVSAILQLGDRIDAQWTYDDLENAKKQKAEAEATLRKFAVG
jgi:hypothetical protein